MDHNVVWEPQPKQALFMSEPSFEVLYGGAAGGGKSDALCVEALRQVDHKSYKGIIFRKTYKELEEIIDRSREIYPKVYPSARYNQSSHTWTFKSGAKILFRQIQHVKDVHKYQGHQYQFVGFDEVTHFTWEEYSYLMSRCRSKDKNVRCYIRATANPGGVGHGWVRQRFVDNEPYKRYFEVIEEAGETLVRDRCYIPATLFDNRKLMENDPGYLATLAMLPEATKKALLYGDWNTFSGQVFTEFRNLSEVAEQHAGEHRPPGTHVIKPFKIPQHWKIYRGYDYGYSKPFACGWYAVDTDGIIYRIAEYYGCTGEPNVGVKMHPTEQAQGIRDIEESNVNLKGRKIIGIADPAIFEESKGASIERLMNKAGVFNQPADHKRLPGKMQIHYRLSFDEYQVPKFYVFDTCRHFIRTLPNLVYDQKHVEDINSDCEDHCLVGDTIVWSEKGKIKIKDMPDSGKVYSHDGKLHEYYDCRCTQKQVDVYTVELEDGTKITATKNHRFMLESGKWKRLDELTTSDEIKVIL